jgi:sister chromatid cohesion protein PDS5
MCQVSSNPAFRLAIEVCNASSDKLVRPVSLYFTDTIIQHTYSDAEDGGDDDAGGGDFDTLQAAHALVKRLHKYCPKLLLSVIPQLQEELAVDNLKIRLLATQTLGEMFAQMHHGSELTKERQVSSYSIGFCGSCEETNWQCGYESRY